MPSRKKPAPTTLELPFPASRGELRVVAAPRLAPLFDHLADRLAAEPLPPFEREAVMVVHNTGLSSWIEHRLADRLGCAAAIETVAPRSLADRMVRDYLGRTRLVTEEGDQVMRDPFELAGLTWSIHAILSDLPQEPHFDPLRAYLDRAGTGALPLAARLARVFDDYQVYRPELLAAWRRGEDPLAEWPPSAWQMPLWRLLCDAATMPESGEPILDRAGEMLGLIDWFERQRGAPDRLPTRLTVFGALVFPQIYARMLRAISRFVPITWYAVLPPGSAAGAVQPLRRLLGGQITEFKDFLRSAGSPEVEHLELPAGDEPSTALHVLQQDILQNRRRQPGERAPLAGDDASLRIHDCHGPLRELEVMRDQILDAFDTIPGLRPDEVVILLADLKSYAPLVDAVFGGSEGDARLPYHIVRNPRGPAQRVLDAFVRLLALAGGRITAPELLELLDEPSVRRAAGIREEEAPDLREWVRRTHIRWGTDGSHKSAFGLPEDDAHTWRHGLDRLMLGYAMGETEAPVLGVLPYAEQALDRADLLGRFALWTQTLFDELDALRASRELDAWSETLAQLLTTFFDPLAEEELEAVRFVRQQVADLAQLHHLVPAGGRVPFAAVRSHLTDAISRYEGRDRVLTGRITVTDFERLRYAPFRVIACAGLNDGAFPREPTSPTSTRAPSPASRATTTRAASTSSSSWTPCWRRRTA
jgi:exodeoxyribonuclease V gamma subunit